ncbi:metallophosphoesterase family protein [Microvirga alba]|uniref:DNA repair exonuclease n=1 Tax=Microvirga alba TaxID=2791025 RepID=A0A931BST8_9HYPH|nr:DNA repair exonuclease [Microvirga alba]MBF9235348.1 DNA repair exonuclease [Microvirga alba]
MAFRFLHTADWQIGKPFANIAGDSGAELRSQRIKTVESIAQIANERAVDAILVAGDAFDSNEVSDRTIVRTIEALAPFSGSWIFLPGNHDAALAHSVWTRMHAMGLPSNIVIADKPEPIDRWNGRATVLPAPLRRRRESLDQTEWFDQAPSSDGSCRIGLAHGSVANRLPGNADSSNEIPEDRAERAGLCYLALGDWHGALKIAPRTWYSGAPEPDRHKANDAGSIFIVDIDRPRAPERVETLNVGRYYWIRIDIELIDGTCERALQALEGLSNEYRTCVVFLNLTGAISLAERRRLELELKKWEARVHHLEIDDSGLIDEPTPDDLDALDNTGFVRLAVERLRLRASDPGDPESSAARMALRMMYLDHFAKGA